MAEIAKKVMQIWVNQLFKYRHYFVLMDNSPLTKQFLFVLRFLLIQSRFIIVRMLLNFSPDIPFPHIVLLLCANAIYLLHGAAMRLHDAGAELSTGRMDPRVGSGHDFAGFWRVG